jgi:hypothetical protein
MMRVEGHRWACVIVGDVEGRSIGAMLHHTEERCVVKRIEWSDA